MNKRNKKEDKTPVQGMFVKWSCGCVGLWPEISEPQSGKSLIISVCDGDDDDFYWSFRDMEKKTYKYLNEAETKFLNIQIRARFGEAERYQAIKRALS